MAAGRPRWIHCWSRDDDVAGDWRAHLQAIHPARSRVDSRVWRHQLDNVVNDNIGHVRDDDTGSWSSGRVSENVWCLTARL